MRELPWSPELYSYLVEHSTDLGPVAGELIEVTPKLTEMPTMQVPLDQAMLLRFLVGALGANDILEIGTFTGLSALAMASGLGAAGGRVVCLDRNAEWTGIARSHWEKAGLSGRIELRLGPALETLASMDPGETFDFVFIDADKPAYADYYEAVMGRLRPGGVIVVDNVGLPGFGTVSARVMFFADHYAGYWKHGRSVGHLFGVIQREGQQADAPAKTSIVIPAEDHVRELIRLGEIGYVRGIEAKLAEIAGTPEHQPFAEAVRAYVQVFDLAGYDAFLKTMDRKEAAPRD